ncbi:MAG TPA: nucleoside 2-deoxyribosyltransferase [bacterium]|nr:nucleoside 2-deoxyribosyltransferase [bacterium]
MKSIVICGSSRFAKEAKLFKQKLEKLGAQVYFPNFYRSSGGDWSRIHEFDKKFVAMGLTYDHFNKIKLADVVFVFNKDGYSGVGTTLEIGYAVALNKPIYALSDKDPELCRHILFCGVIKKPEDLISKLK